MFLTFHDFYEKSYEKTYWFYVLISNLLLLHVSWQIFWPEISYQQNGGCLKIWSNYYLFAQLWATFAKKVMKRPTFFFQYFQTSTFPLCVHKISWQASYKKNYAVCFNMWTKTCLLHKLWTIFLTKIMENPTMCGTCFWSLFQVLDCHAVLSWSHICNKNGSHFNFAKKLLFISNSIFFTPCL